MAMNYVTLGKSGLHVCPIGLGTLNFGVTQKRFGIPMETAREVFKEYVFAGGNFIDTADHYGSAEKMLGCLLIEGHAHRDELVLCSKFTFPDNDPTSPNEFGNGRKNIYRAIDGSLKRLATDYLDLYWMHCWDKVTPVEEVVHTLDMLVASGRIRYWGLSNVPAWYATKAAMLSKNCIALQLEYSLLERGIEREHIPMAKEMGLGLCAWSPLAGGILTGKYQTGIPVGRGRFDGDRDNIWAKFSEKDEKVVDWLVAWAKARNATPAQMAIVWALRNVHVAILGASNVGQMKSNMLTWPSIAELRTVHAMHGLDEVSQPAIGHPYTYFEPQMQNSMSRGLVITRR